MGKQIKNSVGIGPKVVDTTKLVDQPGLEAGPVGDVHESTSLAYMKSFQHQHDLSLLITSGQGESMQSR